MQAVVRSSSSDIKRTLTLALLSVQVKYVQRDVIEGYVRIG